MARKKVDLQKPSAEERTVDMFTGTSRLEVATKEHAVATEEIANETRSQAKTIEESVDAWRNTAFQGQEFVCKTFYQNDLQKCLDNNSITLEEPVNGYRVSTDGNWVYLESLRRRGGDKKAYHYAGLMIPVRDLKQVATVLTEASDKYGI